MRNDRIYLDHNATSPLLPEVSEALASLLTDPTANPSSIHGSGRRVRRLIDQAREDVASFLGAKPSEILFTSGGTEANQLAWNAFRRPGGRIATSTIEHPSVLGAAASAVEMGAEVEWISATQEGALRAPPLPTSRLEFLSIQMANNETGVLHDLHALVQAARAAGALVHTDAVQAVGKVDVNVGEFGIDYLSFSGHKLGAPSGSGALFVKRGSPFLPLWQGGHQERERRTGTENVLGCVGLGVACRALAQKIDRERARLEGLRSRFERELTARIPGVKVTAQQQPRLANTSHVRFEGVDGESLLIAADLDGVDLSTGAACSSGSLKPSHVLLAMGFTPAQAHESIRFSLGWNTSESDVTRVLELLPGWVERVRREAHAQDKRRAG